MLEIFSQENFFTRTSRRARGKRFLSAKSPFFGLRPTKESSGFAARSQGNSNTMCDNAELPFALNSVKEHDFTELLSLPGTWTNGADGRSDPAAAGLRG